jgi:sulfoxide reductase catalytic subunit YedY
MSHPSNLPEREVTPEAALLSRRRWLKRLGLGGIALGAAGTVGGAWWLMRRGADEEILASGRVEVPGAELFPAARSPHFREADRPVTKESAVARYCNFYEFTNGKDVWRHLTDFHPVPWTLEVTGLAAKPRIFDFDQLLHFFSLEERIYRHRCVEAWAMVIPWTGFALAALLRQVEPLPAARFVRFVSFNRPGEASRQQSRLYPWPYCEGLTLAEATNELAFLATGMYGHALLKQHGSPVRLVLPWKYGFKSIKSIARIELTAEQPATFWNTLAPREYDFPANVNPDVPHPRWSQRKERMLGSGEVRPTLLYNGYAEWVAGLYQA